MSRLQAELKQKRPFTSIEQEVFLSLLRTSDYLLRGEVELLRGHDLTFPLYNVLRILRGAEPEGLSCSGISERMVTRDSDITRLIDRLEQKGLARRVRHDEDRRVIIGRITPAGLSLLGKLDRPMEELHSGQLGHLSRKELTALLALLDQARGTGR